MITPDRIKETAKETENEDIRFRSYLKSHANEKELDLQFAKLHEELFADYDCSSCRNCCKRYHAEISPEEICKAADYLHMEEKQFIKKYLKVDKEGTYKSKHMPCDFLQEDGECLLGDCRPDTCKKYPYTDQPDRFFSLFGMLDTITVCPVAYEIWNRLKKIYGFGKENSKGKTWIEEKDVETFLDQYLLDRVSPAYLQYLYYATVEFEKVLEDIRNSKQSGEDKEIEDQIRTETDPAKLIKLMRKNISAYNRELLRDRIQEMDEEMEEAIKTRALTNRQDTFIENAMDYFMNCRKDPCGWIMDSYSSFKSEYMKSVLCLVLGFRGTEEMIPFLIEEAKRMKAESPDEQLEQGPVMAVRELAWRFLGMDIPLKM